jgi:hypothetical protein
MITGLVPGHPARLKFGVADGGDDFFLSRAAKPRLDRAKTAGVSQDVAESYHFFALRAELRE